MDYIIFISVCYAVVLLLWPSLFLSRNEEEHHIYDEYDEKIDELITERDNLIYKVKSWKMKGESPANDAGEKEGGENEIDEERLRAERLARLTCENCSRVFNSDFGINYHKKHKVCLTRRFRSEAKEGLPS